MKPVHRSIRRALNVPSGMSDAELQRFWKSRTSDLCKPCWELHYCPYGPLVEEFPLIPVPRADCEAHNEYLRGCLKSGLLADGRVLDSRRRKQFKAQLASYRPNDYPETIPRYLADASCRVYGHICPVFTMAERLTETMDMRKHNRSISRDVMLKVVRRDGQICQKCHEPVPDNEVEFDHIIPFSKGGRSTSENLRLVHRACNRKKSDSLNDILHPNPIEHLFKLRKTRGRKK